MKGGKRRRKRIARNEGHGEPPDFHPFSRKRSPNPIFPCAAACPHKRLDGAKSNIRGQMEKAR